MLIGNRNFDFSHHTYIMGILNITPDSFSDGGRFLDPEKALDHALALEDQGADLIDVGGESTRPGAKPVPEEEELRRIAPVLEKIIPNIKIPISLDTRKAKVAYMGLSEGVSLINDISALSDSGMTNVIAKFGVPVILMHMHGTPETMQMDIHYDDVISEIHEFLQERIRTATEGGILREKILVDPGIGFGKRVEDNLEILRRLSEFRELGVAVVLGTSRKSFARKIFGESPEGVLLGSMMTSLFGALHGASILRVHDVRETKNAIHLAKLVNVL